jgi:hypothetical protein
MKDIVYKSKAWQEREEMEAALRLQQLGDGVVYTIVRGIPTPTAIPTAARMPVMEELPRRVSGMHPTALARETISQGLYTSTTEYILPKQVPEKLVLAIQEASALCKIKKGLDYCMNKMKSLKKMTEAIKKLSQRPDAYASAAQIWSCKWPSNPLP